MKNRYLTLRLAGTKLRTAKYRGEDHLVVPVVALVEGVIQASNAHVPELVLASEFGANPEVWNGRPVVFNHPTVNGRAVSANAPGVLERVQLGTVFGARLNAKRLELEAWLSPKMCASAKSDVLERLEANGTVEVSVGVIVDTDDKVGTYQGVRYAAVWRRVLPDHLAMLAAGIPGACSVSMGCGANRAACAHEDATTRDRVAWVDHPTAPVDEPLEMRCASFLLPDEVKMRIAWPDKDGNDDHGRGEHTDADKKKADKEEAVQNSGRAEEATIKAEKSDTALDWDRAAFAHEEAMEAAMEVGNDKRERYHREERERAIERGRKADDEGRTAAARKEEPVKKTWRERFAALMTKWNHREAAFDDGPSTDDLRARLSQALYAQVPAYLAVVSTFPEANAVIYCSAPEGVEVYHRRTYATSGDELTLNDDAEVVERVESYEPVVTAASQTQKTAAAPGCECGGTVRAAEKEENMKKDLIVKILAAVNTPFTAEDQPALEAMTEARLTALAARSFEGPKETVVEKIVEKPTEMTEARAIELFPRFASLVAEKEQRDVETRARLTALMKGNEVYSDAELAAMSLEALEKVVRVAGKKVEPAPRVLDFGGRGTPSSGAPADDKVAPPPSTHAAIRAARGIVAK